MSLSSKVSSVEEGSTAAGIPSTIDGGGGSSSNGSSSNSIDASLSITSRGVQQQQQQDHHHHHHQQQHQHEDLRDSSPSSFAMQPAPMPFPDTHIVNFQQSSVPDYSEPLSFFLDAGRNDSDPFGFGVGSVSDGTFGGRKPTPEELLLFRSHRLLQGEAVGVAIDPSHTSGPDAMRVHKRFSHVSEALERNVRMKVLEQTNTAVGYVRGLGTGASMAQQQDVINVERRTCHRLLASILDAATSSLREISASTGGDRGLGGAGIGAGPAFSSSLLGSPATESQQLASTWEDATTASSMNNILGSPSLHSMQQHQHQHHQHQQHPQHQQSILHNMPPGMGGRSSVFALTQMRDRSQHHHSQLGVNQGSPGAHLGGGGMPQSGVGGDFDLGSGSAVPPGHSFEGLPIEESAESDVGQDRRGGGKRAIHSTAKAKKKSGLVTKTSSNTLTDPRRPLYNNRKGSRHRLTPQAKEILETWLAKHWLNPYPTEEEKAHLAQDCRITVTQVNNWMMNVRVRRCRTKKIGLATGPEQITYPENQATPKALSVNRAGRPASTRQGGGRMAASTSSSPMVATRQKRFGTGASTAATAAAVAAAAAAAAAEGKAGSTERSAKLRSGRQAAITSSPTSRASSPGCGKSSPPGGGGFSGVSNAPWHSPQQDDQLSHAEGHQSVAVPLPV